MDVTFTDFSSIEKSDFETYAKSLETIFQYNLDVDRTAYLNWKAGFRGSQREQFVVLGDAFLNSANHLIQQCLVDNYDKKADSWIFPIMFNIVHGIEIYLKAINVSMNVVLNKENATIVGGHDIRQLCNTARNLIIEYKNINKDSDAAKMFTSIKVIANFIDNIYEKTTDMTFARYPMDRNKKGQFYIEAFENEVVDLVRLEKQVVIVRRLLAFIYLIPELELERRA